MQNGQNDKKRYILKGSSITTLLLLPPSPVLIVVILKKGPEFKFSFPESSSNHPHPPSSTIHQSSLLSS